MHDALPVPGPALALLDVSDIPRGLQMLDALVKEAEITVLSAGTIHDGRYLVMFSGEVEPVVRAFDRARSVVGEALYDAVILPWADERMAPAILDGSDGAEARGDTLGVLQTGAAPTLVRALDAALKGAHVDLIQIRVADGLGGKAIATVRGETHDVEAAVELGDHAARRGRVDGWSSVVIRNVDSAVTARGGKPFHREWRG